MKTQSGHKHTINRSWKNPSAWSDKARMVKRHLGHLDEGKAKADRVVEKRLILSHHKNLNRGHYLIDDRTRLTESLILKVNLYTLVLKVRDIKIGTQSSNTCFN